MRFNVYPLPYRGRRLAWREVLNGPSYVGDLHTYEVEPPDERFTVATLFPDDPASEMRLPPLYEPVLARDRAARHQIARDRARRARRQDVRRSAGMALRSSVVAPLALRDPCWSGGIT